MLKPAPLVHACRLLRGDAFLGTSRLTGQPVYLPGGLRLQHVYAVGKSGYGKTTLIRNGVQQDLLAGNGLAVLGPDEDLFERQILPMIPESRLDDVVYIDPADTARPVPLNPFRVEPGEDLDLKVDDTLTVFKRIFADDAGGAHRMDTILRNTIYTLTHIAGSTPLDIEKLLDRKDGSFRQRAVSQLESEEVRRYWTETYPGYPKDAHTPVLSRLTPFLQPEKVRHTLCAPGSFNFRQAMDTGKIVLVNLSESRLGFNNAQIIGQLVVTKLQLAALSRADTPERFRRPFYVYIDEFQTFCGGALESYQTMFSRTRKYHVPLTIAHLQTKDLPEPVMRTILGTVSNIVVFRVGYEDATRLGRELVRPTETPNGVLPRPLDPGLLVELPQGHAWCRIGSETDYVITSPPPEPGDSRIAAEAKQRSRTNHGVPFTRPALIEARSTSEPAGRSKQHAIESIDPGQVF